MDCKTARLLLAFVRPEARELETEEAAELQRHLDHCPDCHSRANYSRSFDDCLGKAMRQVEVPAGLREQILTRLESARSDWHRQRFACAARRGIAAAAVLLLVWYGWGWLREHLATPVDTQQVANAVSTEATEDPRLRAERALKELGFETPLSPYLDYTLLICPPALAKLPGYPNYTVPMLVFARNGRVAHVYLIRKRALPPNTLPLAGGGSFKAELLPSAGEPYRFLVIHDGDNINWLRPPEPPAT
jgi:hypothetical protein